MIDSVLCTYTPGDGSYRVSVGEYRTLFGDSELCYSVEKRNPKTGAYRHCDDAESLPRSVCDIGTAMVAVAKRLATANAM